MTKSSSATASEQSSKPSPEHRRLDIFVGKWNMEGQQFDGLVGPAAKITAVNTYEWLTGGLFLIHRFEGRVGDAEVACIEIIGHDPASQGYPTHSFYNNGITNQWQTGESDGIWTLIGDWQVAGTTMKVRCTTEFGDSGNTMTGKWEHWCEGSCWQTFWEVKAKKGG